MITFMLGLVLGICGIIQPESFDGWCFACIFEFILDLPTVLIVMNFIAKHQDRIHAEKQRRYRAKSRVHRPNDKVVDEEENLNMHDFRTVYEYMTADTENPYAEGTLRHDAIEERREEIKNNENS